MKISIKNYLYTKGISGDIILYRDNQHKKKEMCEFLAQKIKTSKKICCSSKGAFGLYLAKAFSSNAVIICSNSITSEYADQIKSLPNTVIDGSSKSVNMTEYANLHGFLHVNQFAEPYIKHYYKQHFTNLLSEVGTVDAFVDCGHTCATLAGAIESGANLEFVLGVNNPSANRKNLHFLADHQGKFKQETTCNFDTALLQIEIEAMYPSFGNIFEATRSISAAMSWLQKNPNKTVLVYVGDSPVLGQDVSIN